MTMAIQRVYCNRQELPTLPEHQSSLPFHRESVFFICIYAFAFCRSLLIIAHFYVSRGLYFVIGCWSLIASSVFFSLLKNGQHTPGNIRSRILFSWFFKIPWELLPSLFLNFLENHLPRSYSTRFDQSTNIAVMCKKKNTGVRNSYQ